MPGRAGPPNGDAATEKKGKARVVKFNDATKRYSTGSAHELAYADSPHLAACTLACSRMHGRAVRSPSVVYSLLSRKQGGRRAPSPHK